MKNHLILKFKFKINSFYVGLIKENQTENEQSAFPTEPQKY